VATKHRMMINVDKSVYEWIRDHSHTSRTSMSGILNELVKNEMVKSNEETEIAANRVVVGAVS